MEIFVEYYKALAKSYIPLVPYINLYLFKYVGILIYI